MDFTVICRALQGADAGMALTTVYTATSAVHEPGDDWVLATRFTAYDMCACCQATDEQQS